MEKHWCAYLHITKVKMHINKFGAKSKVISSNLKVWSQKWKKKPWKTKRAKNRNLTIVVLKLSLCDGDDDPQGFQTATTVDLSAEVILRWLNEAAEWWFAVWARRYSTNNRGCGRFWFTAASHMRARAMTEGVAVWCSQCRSGPNLAASDSKTTINFVIVTLCCRRRWWIK